MNVLDLHLGVLLNSETAKETITYASLMGKMCIHRKQATVIWAAVGISAPRPSK